jgi:hypothetical protein
MMPVLQGKDAEVERVRLRLRAVASEMQDFSGTFPGNAERKCSAPLEGLIRRCLWKDRIIGQRTSKRRRPLAGKGE